MRMTAHDGDGDVEVTYGDVRFARLSRIEAVDFALRLLALAAAHPGAEAYGATEWVSIGDVMRILGLPRSSASRLAARFQTVHRRVPGGDRYVARVEVDAWVARALGVVKRKAA